MKFFLKNTPKRYTYLGYSCKMKYRINNGVLTRLFSFSYLKTIQKLMYFGLLFHLKLVLRDFDVLQKSAHNFSFSRLG